MQHLSQFLSPEVLDTNVVPGISLGFALIFFGPLSLVCTAFWFYCIFANSNPTKVAKKLSTVWLLACIPASMLILMGYAFNSNKLHPLIAVPAWVAAGLLLLWLPVGLRHIFGASK